MEILIECQSPPQPWILNKRRLNWQESALPYHYTQRSCVHSHRESRCLHCVIVCILAETYSLCITVLCAFLQSHVVLCLMSLFSHYLWENAVLHQGTRGKARCPQRIPAARWQWCRLSPELSTLACHMTPPSPGLPTPRSASFLACNDYISFKPGLTTEATFTDKIS